MNVFDAIRTVLAVRQYDTRSVPREVIARVIESARLTASSRNGQPWHFVVVEQRETLGRLGEVARSGPYVTGAAFAIAVAYEKASPYGVSDASRAIQSMVLTAWDEGVGSNWIGFAKLADVNTILAIPDDLEVLAVVAFGYPAERIAGLGKKNRKPLAEVASSERFGRPFE